MPKASQKVSRRRVEASSSDDSDSATRQPPKNAGSRRKNAEQNTRRAAIQENGVDQNNVVDSDEDVPNTSTTSDTESTQRSGAHPEKQFAQMSVEDRERIANDIVRYLLTVDYRKHPVKQVDIRKHALKDYSRAFNSLMKIATEKLRRVFGIEVVETEVGKQKAYMLINALDNKYDAAHQTWPDEDHAHMSLVMVLLSVIFMKGNVLTEEDLFDLLSRLGITQDRPDETFGDIKHLIMTDFVRQGYLEVEREQGSDPPVHLFRWGPRAKAETSKRHTMDFICQVFGDDSPDRWTAQMHDIEQSQAAEKSAGTESVRPSSSRST